MNCKHINKFICFKVNFKPFTTKSPAKFEQIFSSFLQNPNEQMKTVKFVPIIKVPKISTGIYHDPAQQANISKRILSLRNGPTSGTVGAKVQTNRLQNLIQLGPSSLMNFSTKRIVKSRSAKSITKHKMGSIGSSSRSSFIGRSNTFLNKFIISNAESFQKRYKSTGGCPFAPSTRQRNQNANIKISQVNREGSSYSGGRNDSKNAENDRDDNFFGSNEMSEDVTGKLEEVTARIRDDLMKIDGTMKERLISMRNRMTSGMVQTGEKDEPRTGTIGNFRADEESLRLNLMPMMDKKDALATYLQETKDDQRPNTVGTITKPTGIVRIRRDMVQVDQPGDGRRHGHQLIEPMAVRGHLMDLPVKTPREEATSIPLQSNSITRDRHVLGIRIKDAADADGVYFVRRRRV